MSCSCQTEEKAAIQRVSTETQISALEELINRYKGVEGSLISVLQGIQEMYGYLPRQVLEYIAKRLDIKKARIYGVATFYAQFRLTPVGKHLILLCQGTACHVNGADKIEAALCDELGVEMGGTTENRLFTLTEAACLGCCSLAPVMMIDGQAYGPLTPDQARKVIRGILKQEEQSREEVGA